MNIGLYQSAASLSALERWQDAVAQNITSSQVTGYRKRTVEFSAVTGGQWNVASAGEGQTTVSAQFPKASNSVNFQGADTAPTQRDLDMAIQGEGFFELQAPDGTKAYTRSGEFKIGSDRILTAGSGAQVMSDSGSPITLLATGAKVTINPDGTVTQGAANLGKIAVMKFDSMTDLKPVAGGLFVPTNGTTATVVDKPQVLQGYLEASNVTPMREMVDMVLISRSYEANQKIIKTADEQMQKVLDALG
jgi:flagellar basal body rod protein FlgG